MSLKGRLAAYLVVLHLALAALAIPMLRKSPGWLLAAEAAFVLSFAASLALGRALMKPIEILESGAQLLRDGDFGTRLRRTGTRELDGLVDLTNGMLERLHEERVRQQEQQAFLARILEASPLGVVTLDLDGRVDTASPAAAELLGEPEAALRGRRLDEAPGPLPRALVDLPPGGTRVVAYQGARRVRVSRTQLLDRGFPRSAYLLLELTEELRRSEKAAYEKLIRMMSHEVNNTSAAVGSLLTSCLAYAPMLPGGDRDDYEAALQVAIRRTGQLAAFMRSLAEVVKVPEPRRAPHDVNALAEATVRLLAPEAERRGVTLALEADPSLAPVSLDSILLEQALVNVVKNALEAARSRVTVRTVATGRGLLVVEDDGPPIPEEVSAQLFTPFFTTKPDGHGVGLTLVQEILERHGFGFSLESRLGERARFTVQL